MMSKYILQNYEKYKLILHIKFYILLDSEDTIDFRKFLS